VETNAASPDNPCRYKSVCKNCNLTLAEDRPSMCVSIRCEHYTPCKKCRQNKSLDDKGLCSSCVRNKTKVAITTADGSVAEVPRSHVTNFQLDTPAADDVPQRSLSITAPGTPPREYSEEEKEIYNATWNEYLGFYRDPTTRALLHNIIILEIELSWATAFIIGHRDTASKEMESRRSRIIKNLTDLRSQLPEKEANEESDDERFFSMIYERYVEEKKLRAVGKVSRILSQEALALAPHLQFPVNPERILANLGFRTVDALEACNHIILKDLPDSPIKFLEFLGFFLQEKYALPMPNEPVQEERELLPVPDLEDIGPNEQFDNSSE
jgi:hypothetical protein